jgi:plasmid maintenance system killer protein
MEISYKSKKLEKQLTDPKKMNKAFGVMAKKVNQRMKDLSGAETLADLRKLPAARCHELTGNKDGSLAVDVSGNYRLVFEPDHIPIPEKEDGGLDWQQVTRIKILSVEDYH